MTQINTQAVFQDVEFISNTKFIDRIPPIILELTSCKSQKNIRTSHLSIYIYQVIFFYQQVITIEEANKLVGSLKFLYTGLILKGYYLPKYNSACITSEYLLEVTLSKVFSCKQKDIKVAYLIRQSAKIDIYRELHQLIGQEEELGFTSEKLPDREWLINILYYVSPNHRYFKQPSINIQKGLTSQDIQKLKELNTSMYRQKRFSIFKSSIQQQKMKKVNKIKQQIEKIQTKLQEETKKQTNASGKLQNLKTTLKSIQLGNAQDSNENFSQMAFQQNVELQEEVQSDQ